jgi:hypothetical protein
VRFGLDIAQHQLTWDEILGRARYAEEAGFDGAWVFDHFTALYADPDGPCLEGWTLLAALGAATERIRLGTLVTGMTHRHPSLLATEVVTVDHVSGGRVECAVGAAWNVDEHRERFGFCSTRRTPGEGAEILRLLMSGERGVRRAPLPSAGGPVSPAAGATTAPADLDRGVRSRAHAADRGPSGGRLAHVGWGLLGEVGRGQALGRGRRPRPRGDRSGVEPVDQRALGRGPSPVRRPLRTASPTVDWPSEGRARLEAFVEEVMPDLG